MQYLPLISGRPPTASYETVIRPSPFGLVIALSLLRSMPCLYKARGNILYASCCTGFPPEADSIQDLCFGAAVLARPCLCLPVTGARPVLYCPTLAVQGHCFLCSTEQKPLALKMFKRFPD